MWGVVGSVLLTVALGGYWFTQVVAELGRQARQEREQLLALDATVGEAIAELSEQTQEWKDILLRAYDPVLREKHQRAFDAHAQSLQAELRNVQDAARELGLDADDMAAFARQHQALMADYRAAFTLFDPKNPLSYRLVDQHVQGRDRLLRDGLRRERAKLEVQIAAREQRLGARGLLGQQWLKLGALAMLLPLLSLWIFWQVYRALREIVQSDARFRAIYHAIGDAVLVADMQGRVESINDTAQNLLGWREAEARGRPIGEVFELYDVHHRQRVESPAESVLRDGRPIPMSNGMMLCRRDGSRVAVEDSAAPVRDEQGNAVGVVMVFRDVSQRYALLDELRAARAQFETLFEQLPEGVLLFDENLMVIAHNREAAHLLEYGSDEMLRLRLFDIEAMDGQAAIAARREKLQQTGRDDFESLYRTRSGCLMEVDVSVQLVHLPDGRMAFQTLFRDITEQKQAAAQIEHLAYHDQLTGLPNRRLLHDRLSQAISSAVRRDATLAVIYLDLDHFKDVNDSLGHGAGDVLLQVVAGRLLGCVRADDTLARMGGDEFVLLLNGVNGADDVAGIAAKIMHELSQPLSVGDDEWHITPSLGISLCPQDGRDADDLLKYADVALYQAKQQGRATYRFCTQALHDQSVERVQLERLLRHALERNEFELYYQPQVDLCDGQIIGCEALIRWNHPGMGQISPGRFIPIAEHSGLIIDIGNWVMQEACRQAKRWHEQGRNIKISFNVSARQFMRPAELMRSLRHALAESGVDAALIQVELTESLLLDPQGMGEVLREIRALGIHLALDDFGTGYSSLSYLRRFPISILKIDQSFVSEADNNQDDAEMVKTIIGMAHNLRMGIVAEGIETEAQRALLAVQGCQVGQGYHYSRPVPAEEFTRLLQHGIAY
jgi:diguanylate cyclase (GGDEF)-like protein/PAS domain S-box-containing protein